MAKKKPVGKSAIIRTYLEENPTHTWKDAEATLSKKGVTSNYFSMVKSKLNGKPKRATKKAPKAVDAVQFARSCGGIDKAIEKLKELEQYQV